MTHFLWQVGWETWSILMEAAFFLLLGFVLAGVLAVLVPSNLVQRLLGRGRVASVLWASAIGVPLPLCSCGVLPGALRLSRQGATKGATVSFLISTPETDVDAIALTYGLMGPIFAVFRAVAGVVTAVAAGLATNWFGEPRRRPVAAALADSAAPPTAPLAEPAPAEPPHPEAADRPAGPVARAAQILHYAFRELLDEMAHWLVLGILVGAVVTVLLPPSVIERYLSGGLTTLLLMLLIAIPIYTCASASTPIAAALVLKGLDPGAALVFLLAGPATNIGAVIVLLKFLGRRVVAIYLASIVVVSVVAGYILNELFARWQLDPVAEIGAASGFLPEPVKLASAVLLVALLVTSLARAPLPAEWLRAQHALGRAMGIRLTARRLALAGLAGALALYLGSGVFAVGIGESALRTRFGRVVGDPLGPGLHVRLPWPIESHRLVHRDRIRRLEVGFRSSPRLDTAERAFARQLTVAGPRHPVPPGGSVGFGYQKEKVVEESFLLTGDENIIDVAFAVQYQVNDPMAYAFGVVDPDAVVRSVTVSVLRAIVATLTVDVTYTSGRDEIARAARQAVQDKLDAYGMGVHVVGVGVLSVHAPAEVHAAFRDVASAQEDRILITDRAMTFAEESVNLAEGEAAAMVESALAFKKQRILHAEGDAEAFGLRERAYRPARDLTQFRLHLEALEAILPTTQKILRPGSKDLREFDLWLLDPPGARKAP